MAVGCEGWRRASCQHPTPGQAGAAPRCRHACSTYAGHRSWCVRAAFNHSAQSSSRSLKRPQDFRKKKTKKKKTNGWKTRQPWASRKGDSTAFGYGSAAEQRHRGPAASVAKACTPPRLAEDSESIPVAWQEQRVAHGLWLAAQHSTHATRALSAATHRLPAGTWAMPRHAAAAALARLVPRSRQAGWVGVSVAVCLSVCAHLALRGPSVWELCCHAAWPAHAGVIQCSYK